MWYKYKGLLRRSATDIQTFDENCLKFALLEMEL